MNIVWLSVKEGTPGRGYWDQKLIESFFEKEQNFYSVDDVKGGAIVVIPGAYQAPFIEEINAELAKLSWCIVIVTSDEENNFPIDELQHPRMVVFANYYNPKYASDIYWLPIGAANTFNIPLQEKTRNFAFSGQVTHPARENYIKELRHRTDGELNETQGFAQGFKPADYYKFIASAKVVPSPAGNISPDAFRTWEAISAGAVPIPVDPAWHKAVFGTVPFPVVGEYSEVDPAVSLAITQYPKLNNKVQAWWLWQQHKYKEAILGAAEEFGAVRTDKKHVTVVIPTSPIKSHPSIKIIDETIRTVRVHLPEEKIIVTFDGVRPEQEDRRKDYEEFKRRFLWECYHNPLYKNVLPIFFDEHSHQVKMARKALEYVDTPYILYVEQDTPLTPDIAIDWERCIEFLDSEQANLIRFHFEASIPKEHRHLMLGEPMGGFLKTIQWSQRPHLANKAYYKHMLYNSFTLDANSFIEDKMHGVLQDAHNMYGMKGWARHKVWIYYPEDGQLKRSYHTDGRSGEEKWDDRQVF